MGRNRKPDELQRLRGNPRKHKLALDVVPGAAIPSDDDAERAHGQAVEQSVPLQPGLTSAAASVDAAAGDGAAAAQDNLPEIIPPAAPDVAYPDFLTGARERGIFDLIVREFMPRNMVKVTDFNAYGRYCTMMAHWIDAKEELGTNGRWYLSESKHGTMYRRHPAFADMIDLDHSLRQMEAQLGLTPLSRAAIMGRFMARPGGFELTSPPADDAGAQDDKPAKVSALGFLAGAAAAGQA